MKRLRSRENFPSLQTPYINLVNGLPFQPLHAATYSKSLPQAYDIDACGSFDKSISKLWQNDSLAKHVFETRDPRKFVLIMQNVHCLLVKSREQEKSLRDVTHEAYYWSPYNLLNCTTYIDIVCLHYEPKIALKHVLYLVYKDICKRVHSL